MRPLPREGFEVQVFPAYRATKSYTCPDCHNMIDVGVGHVVAWENDAVDERRHWHRHCWRLTARREGASDG